VDRVIWLVVGAVVAVLGGMLWLSGQEAEVYREIVVREIKGEPDTVRTFVDRVVYRDREPELVAVEPGGGEDVVEDFCRPDTVVQVLQGDTVWVAQDTVFLMRSVVHDAGWFFARDNIRVYGPTSAGDLREMRYSSYGGWSIRAGEGVLFREPRFGWGRPLLEALAFIGLGYFGGKVF